MYLTVNFKTKGFNSEQSISSLVVHKSQ